MEKEYQKLLKKSQPHEVTIAMLKERMGLTCSGKTASRACWQRGIHFKPLYEKPVLTEGDKAERLAWTVHIYPHINFLETVEQQSVRFWCPSIFLGFSYLLIHYIVAN